MSGFHGRRRVDEVLLTEDEKKQREKKLIKYIKVRNVILERMSNNICDIETLTLLSQMISINPDWYLLWNYRRKIFKKNLSEEVSENKLKKCEDELKIVEIALKKNPKCYSAWYHRQWIIQLGFSDLNRELFLCTQFLKLDERNFHCWNYRRWITNQSVTTPRDEFDYTTSKIIDNFSNYSAWHHRTTVASCVFRNCNFNFNTELSLSPTGSSEYSHLSHYDNIKNEFSFVRQAFFTDPGDPSSWMYYQWLLLHSKVHFTSNNYLKLLEQEKEICQSIIELEPRGKWAHLTYCYVLIEIIKTQRIISKKISKFSIRIVIKDIHEHFVQLLLLDPLRRQYYIDIFKNFSLSLLK